MYPIAPERGVGALVRTKNTKIAKGLRRAVAYGLFELAADKPLRGVPVAFVPFVPFVAFVRTPSSCEPNQPFRNVSLCPPHGQP